MRSFPRAPGDSPPFKGFHGRPALLRLRRHLLHPERHGLFKVKERWGGDQSRRPAEVCRRTSARDGLQISGNLSGFLGESCDRLGASNGSADSQLTPSPPQSNSTSKKVLVVYVNVSFLHGNKTSLPVFQSPEGDEL